MRSVSRLFLAVLLLGSCVATQAARGPEDTVAGFYAARVRGGSGVPSGRELAEYSSYLSPELVCLLGAALRYDDKFAQAHPGSKGPFAEGDLYSSSAQIPQRFVPGALQQSGGSASLPVHFYLDAAAVPPADAASAAVPGMSLPLPLARSASRDWQDTVHLKIIRKRWLITDISYQGGAQAANQGELVARLRNGLQNATPVAGWKVSELDSCHIEAAAAGSSTASHAKGAKAKHAAARAGKATKASAGKKAKASASGARKSTASPAKKAASPAKKKSSTSTSRKSAHRR